MSFPDGKLCITLCDDNSPEGDEHELAWVVGLAYANQLSQLNEHLVNVNAANTDDTIGLGLVLLAVRSRLADAFSKAWWNQKHPKAWYELERGMLAYVRRDPTNPDYAPPDPPHGNGPCGAWWQWFRDTFMAPRITAARLDGEQRRAQLGIQGRPTFEDTLRLAEAIGVRFRRGDVDFGHCSQNWDITDHPSVATLPQEPAPDADEAAELALLLGYALRARPSQGFLIHRDCYTDPDYSGAWDRVDRAATEIAMVFRDAWLGEEEATT